MCVCVCVRTPQVVSRGHRLPKPYANHILHKDNCVPDKSKVPWPAVGLEHQESLSRYNLTFRISRIYLQPFGDATVQCMSCLGAHAAIQGFFWTLLTACTGLGMCSMLASAWRQNKSRRTWDLAVGVTGLVVVQAVGFYICTHIR